MAKKFNGYTPVSPLSAGLGLAVTGVALTNPTTAPFAAPIGTMAAGFADGINLTDEEMTIKEKFDAAMNKTWHQIFVEYNLTDDCLTDLKQDVIGEGTSTNDFVNNSQRKHFEEGLVIVIQAILERHKERLNWYSEKPWNNEFIERVSKDIASRLIKTIKSVFEEEDLLKILKAIADRSDIIRTDLCKNREDEKLAHEQIMKLLREISETINSNYADKHSADFNRYYEYVKKRFTRKKEDEYKALVGEYSDEESYINAYIEVDGQRVSVLHYLEQWFTKDSFGTLLIYGEPGHGKTTLCNKAIVEFSREQFLKGKAKNVIAVSLNTGNNREIVKDEKLHLDAALVWGGEKHAFTFKDCHGALLFFDGFDEFIDEAKRAGVDNIVSFMRIINEIAGEYDIHIVVLSRTIAVQKDLQDPWRINGYMLMPITHRQQDNWLYQHSKYNDYRETFFAIRQNIDMNSLFGIPFLFRLIVHSRFAQISMDIVELYDKLIDHLMTKRNIRGKELELVSAGLYNLAYSIYCTDTDTAVLEEDESDKRWLITFYIQQFKKKRIGFLHRSFYQYFLAKFIYSGIWSAKNEDMDNYISYFAERELDDTIRYYLSLMINEEDKETIHGKLQLMINALIRTEAYGKPEPRIPSGNAEKSKLVRTINIYRNTLHICAAFSYSIQIPFKDSLDVFLRTYPSDCINIYSSEKERANLTKTNLNRAELSNIILRYGDLSYADLTGANLSGSDLSNAILYGANLSETNIMEANLSGADLRNAVLSGANLTGTNLKEANLIGADLSQANLQKANLDGANLSSANLTEANLYRASLCKANLYKAKLCGANLNSASLSESDMKEADLFRSHMNLADLRETDLFRADLSRAYLRNANLYKANLYLGVLRGAYLNNANLEEATLTGSTMISAYLVGAVLKSAKLINSTLVAADLRGANLSESDLTRTDFREANLIKANLERANLTKTILDEANLSDADFKGSNWEDVRLYKANLIGANLEEVNISLNELKYMVIDSVYKDSIDPQINGYSTIRWV